MKTVTTITSSHMELKKAYQNQHKLHLLYYQFLGIKKPNDFDISKCSTKKWTELSKQPCLYAIFIEHPELKHPLRHYYTNLYNVKRAIKRNLRKE